MQCGSPGFIPDIQDPEEEMIKKYYCYIIQNSPNNKTHLKIGRDCFSQLEKSGLNGCLQNPFVPFSVPRSACTSINQVLVNGRSIAGHPVLLGKSIKNHNAPRGPIHSFYSWASFHRYFQGWAS